MLRFSLLFSVMLSTMVSATTPNSAEECDDALADEPTVSVGRMFNRIRSLNADGKSFELKGTDQILKKFRHSGWNELYRIAQDNDTNVADILTFYYEKQVFVTESMMTHSPKLAVKLANLKSNLLHVQRSAEILENLNPEDKLKRKHWDALDRIYRMLIQLGEFALPFDIHGKSLHDYVTVDYLTYFTPKKIRLLFGILEDISEDSVIEILADAEDFILEHRDETRQRLAEPVKPVLPLNLPTQSSLPSAAPATNFPFAQPVQVPFQKPVMTFNTPSAALDSDLNLVLKAKMPLEANKPYTATTTRNQKLTVYIEKRIIEDDRGSENHVVRRLLKGIVNGNGKSGIKLLSDTGPHIVELKAVLHGHKRIIGCLEGNKLTLKFLIDIKDNKATYQRRIDSRLCL